MNYTCAAREEAADYAADRLAAFSAPSPARTNLTAIQEAADHAADRLAASSAPSPARTNLTAIQEADDRAAAFAVRFTPPA
ncbi:MAG: hypothetical protein ACLQB1_12200 [Streptosporangiaceae bacterium]